MWPCMMVISGVGAVETERVTDPSSELFLRDVAVSHHGLDWQASGAP